MDKSTKGHTIYLGMLSLSVLVIALLVIALNDQKALITDQESIIRQKNAEIELHINFEGRMVSKVDAAIGEVAMLKKAYPKLLKDVKKKLGVKADDLASIISAKFTSINGGTVPILTTATLSNSALSGEIGITESKKDSIKINDGYLNLKGEIIKEQFEYKYSYTDTLLIAFEKKKSFFKGETISVSGVLSNKQARITQMTGVMVHRIKPKRFNLSVGFYYDPLRNQYGPGINVGYSIIRF